MKTLTFEQLISQVRKGDKRIFSIIIERIEMDRCKLRLVEHNGNVEWLNVVTAENDNVVLKLETKERN